ncbi:spermatogenesis-associated protein 45 [Xenopus tropicalis]|uniref:Spermatogenesis-associated protein 45 n=1 Tax=Xenopus tropicalis TaxID=8364 RepID=A0A8J0QQ12_XENTR|nr:spermatogenesis-associated protein 45 [Xenopus tropicalis]|eukprot:XP_002934748.1 PREDICTED: spermatogenesis-associated protein 45 [Xenopus tropicalis]
MAQADETLQELYESRETWCMVERDPTQYFARAERRHYPHQFKSSLNLQPPRATEGRSTWANITPKHREKRHFPDTGKGHLV